jgi:hypothetical protein
MSLAFALLLSLAQDPDAADRIQRLSRDLGSDVYDVRVKATRELTAIGKPAMEAMRKLAETSTDTEVKSRATQILADIREKLRPRLLAMVVGGNKEKGKGERLDVDDWVHASAAEQGYPWLTDAGSTRWLEVPQKRITLFPATTIGKPGGIYVYGQVVEWTIEGKVVVDVSASMKNWKSGRVELDHKEPRKLIKLSEQGAHDLFLALRIHEGPLPVVAAPVFENECRARVESCEQGKITFTIYQRGDSIDAPSGNKLELVMDADTRVLNIRAQEMKDEAARKRLLAKGSVLIVKYGTKAGKETAVILQAIGG